MSNNFKFQPTKTAEAVQQKLFIKRLPEWMQGLEDIQKTCDDVIQQWFNPAENEIVDGYIGDMGSPAASGKIFIKEATAQRQAYQLSPAYVSRNDDTSIRSLEFYDDLVGYMQHYGALTDNESRLFDGKFYAWTPAINPNKMINYSSYLWDSSNQYSITTPDYIVMERGAINGNTWSLQNYWYTIGQTLEDGTVLTDELSHDPRFIRAQAPIIEYNKNIELMNYGTKFRGVVDLLSDTIKPEDIVNKDINQGIRIDGQIPLNGMRILFTSIGNSGENNRIYTVYMKQMQDGTSVYGLALDPSEENEQRPSGEAIKGDVILVRQGEVYRNSSLYWNGVAWIATQVKDGVNKIPLFQLYDRNGVKLNDNVVYPGNNFQGSGIFGFKINFNYKTDKVYGYNIELGDYNYYIYENFLESVRYTYDHVGVETQIDGLYFYNVIGSDGTMHLKTDWSRNDGYSQQFVKQTPEVMRTDMYRVFSTVFEMENFTNPIENMYAYVIEVDQTYQYYKESNATYMDWHVIVGEGIQSAMYEHTFELAQQILDNGEDIIEVELDGIVSTKYARTIVDGKVQSITFDNDVEIDENTVIQIRTYSKTEVPNKQLGAYEIPINLKNNPYNDNIIYISQSEYTTHFQDIVQKNITVGSVDDFNNYEERLEQGLVNNAVGTKIIQNEASMLPLMTHTANEDIDLFEAVLHLQSDYFRFQNKFSTQMVSLYEENRDLFLANSASNLVDMIFDRINIGRDSSFPYYYDSVASTAGYIRAFVPPTPQFMGILKAHTPEKAIFINAGSKQSCYNISHTGQISKAWRVINGIDKMDDIIFELENRIFNSIDLMFKDEDYQPQLDASDLFPTPYFTDTVYSAEDKKTLLLRGYINFVASNSLDNTVHDYDPQNWMTWNYTGTYYTVQGVSTEMPARGSWRAIYTDQFGTYRPATHPWEMFGFGQRPVWWNQEYEPTIVQVGERTGDVVSVYEALVVNEQGQLVPSGLWDVVNQVEGDASTGTILFGDRAGQYDKYKRFGTQPFTITPTGKYSTDGIEICTIDYIAPEVLGLISGSILHRSEPWQYGDMGDIEFSYMNIALFPYDELMLLYRAKPAQFANYFWDTRNNNMKTVVTGEPQFLYGETRKRINFDSTTIVHGENNTRVLGYQMIVSDYLMYQNKNITTKYGNIVRSSHINVGHKIGGFTKNDQLTFTSESFGLISQENQNIGLVRSSSIRNEQMSAVKITWNGSAYKIDGYDLVGSKFNYKIPVKNGRKVTVDVGNRTVVHYLEWNNDAILPYSTIFNSYQDVYTFICGYGEYLKEHGWIFEDVNESGEQQDWTTIAKNFLSWSQTDLSTGDYISCTPSADSAKFGSDFGSVESITQNSGGVWSLLDDQNQGIRPFEIETSRIGNIFTVRTTDESNRHMALIRISINSYEHAVIFDNQTIFGDYIYEPTYGSIQELIKMYGYVTGSWNGRLQAPGFIILEAGTLPSFETLVSDFQQYYNTDVPVSDVQLRELSRHLIGYQSRDYLQRMITNEPGRIDFYKGFIHDKGTNQVFEKVLRVSKSYNTEEYKALQEWAFKVGTYGNVNGKKNLQFKLINNEFKQQPQMITFDRYGKDAGNGNNIVYFGEQGQDPRWITRPVGKFSFPMREGRSDNIHLPNIGPVTLDEVSYITKNLETAYADRLQYMNNTGENPSSVWMYQDFLQEWNIFDLVDTGVRMLSITPIVTEDPYALKFCTIQLDNDIPLDDGDYYYFIDDTNFMPDPLSQEYQYFVNGTDPTQMKIPFDTSLTINFSDPTRRPRLIKYTSRFVNQDARTDYINAKYSFKAPETTFFDRPSTYDERTNVTELYLNIFDPINGVIPGAAMQDVDFTSPIDPAMYNSNGELLQAWGSDKVGSVWWNTSTAYYLDYTRPILDLNGNVDIDATNEYKRYNWGKLLPHSKIDVLEWVSSPVEPYNWGKYCQEQAKKNKNNTMYLPSGSAIEDNYSIFMEYDTSTDTYVTRYYFWVRDTIYIPPMTSRSKSCTDIARIIEDPTQLNVPWFSPINENSFIVSNMQFEVNDDTSILTVSYYNDHDYVVKHDQYQLCKEGDSYNFNPIIWNSLWNSLIGQETTTNGTSNELIYPKVDTGLGSDKTWFENVIEARRTLVDSANDFYRTQNITTNTVVMNEVFNVKTKEVNPNDIPFRVLSFNNELVIAPSADKFLENDAVLLSSTGTLPAPLQANVVYFVHFDSDGYIRLMNSPSTFGNVITITLEDKGEGQHKMIKQSDYIESLGTSLDMTQYWNLADWYDVGFSSSTNYTKETSIEDADLKNYQIGDVIRITDSDDKWTLYIKTASRNTSYWKAVGRENSTVELNNRLYNDYSVYNSNGTLSNQEINVRKALALLKNSFDNAQSDIVFDMVKYVHVEQSVVDWVFKTSYIYIIGLEQSLVQNYSNDDLINQIVEYFEEVKPYRTKIRSQIEQKTSDTDLITGISNDLDPDGYIFVNGSWVKTQKDIWDYEYAQFNETTQRWEQVGSLPLDFETPSRRFQQINIMMHYDNVQCEPDDVLYSTFDLEAVNAKYQNNSTDAVNHYDLQRYKFTVPEYSSSQLNSLIGALLRETYTDLNLDFGLPQGINNWYKDHVTDLDLTNEFSSDLDRISSSVYASDDILGDTKKYVQYNSLANRLKAYTGESNESIDDKIGCGFDGLVFNDNPNTRLPFGFGASTDYNSGYFELSSELYKKYKSMIEESNPGIDSDGIREILEYEYGVYDYKYDFNERGRYYSDSVYVLSGMLNTFDKDDVDHYRIAENILNERRIDVYAIVMIPRKYVYLDNNGSYLPVPIDKSISEYMEELFITDGADVVLAEINLDDLPQDQNNPMYSAYQSILEGVNGAKYFNDMNSFDNLALESQTKDIKWDVSGTDVDPYIIDISELNPSGRDMSQLRFTVDGYSYDTAGQEQLKDFSRFQVEGMVVLNPYNATEAVVSIPSYSTVMNYMDRSSVQKNDEKYFYTIKSVQTVFEIDVKDNNLNDGDKVMIFTPQGEDYVRYQDSDWVTILSVSKIQENNRPKVYTVEKTTNNSIQLIDSVGQILEFDSITKFNIDEPPHDTALKVVRIRSFADAEFVDNGVKLYEDIRHYKLNAMDYDVFYDVSLTNGKYTDNFSTDDYDLWLVSNEIFNSETGDIVDNGYNQPITGNGVLSELIRTYMTDSVEIMVYEYATADINPVLIDGVWTYSQPVVDNVYIDTNGRVTNVTVIDETNTTYVATPKTVSPYTITDNVISGNTTLNDIIVYGSEKVQVRNDNNLLRAVMYSAEHYLETGTTYSFRGLNLGSIDTMIEYRNYYQPIPISTFENGLLISGNNIRVLLNQK